MMLFLDDLERDRAASGQPKSPIMNLAYGRCSNVIVGMAHVDAEPGNAWHDIDRPRLDGERTDGRSQLGCFECDPFDLEHELGRGRKGIAPARHGQGARMARLAAEFYPELALARDGRDDAERNPEGVEHRPLLDVPLQIAADAAGRIGRFGDSFRVQPEVAKCLSH